MSNQVIQIEQITKYYGPNLILNNVSLTLNRADRVALVGENGCGKTTLAKIIRGDEPAESGDIRLLSGADVGYLPQEATFGAEGKMSLATWLQQSTGRLNALADEMALLEKQMASNNLSPAEIEHTLHQYGLRQEEFEQKGGYTLPHRIDTVLAGLKLDSLDKDRSLATLSGGESTRVALAALLLRSPDLLILDEPTNHLDFAALIWLEDYLAQYKNALLIISHDRRFLNTVANRIIELSTTDHTFTAYAGNYDFYLQERKRIEQKQMDSFWEQQDRIKTLKTQIKTQTHAAKKKVAPPDADKFAKFYKRSQAETTKRKQIQSAKRELNQLLEDKVEAITRKWEIDAEFDAGDFGSKNVIELTGITKRYPGKTLLDNVTQTVCNGQHIALVAPNGTGKTTLLKIILGLLKPDAGTVKLAPDAKPGYLDQNQETLNLKHTVLQAFNTVATGTEAELRTQLHRYGLFSGDQVFQLVGNLSIGQRRKLQLAQLIAAQANVLLIDEPTNHLDLGSVEAFEDALRRFKGTVIATSHDRWFIENFAETIWELNDGQISVTMVNTPKNIPFTSTLLTAPANL